MGVEEGKYIERAAQVTMLDAIDFIATHPTITAEFQELWKHDSNTATHVMRVTLAMIRATEIIGLDSRFAAICGISHDLGKRDVEAFFLRRTDADAQTIAAIREPHMAHLRETIYAIPTEELSDQDKYTVLAVIMSHHEFLSSGNGRSPYPRKTIDGDQSKTPRKSPTVEIHTMQALLALSDTADRISRGFHNTEASGYQQVRERLKAIITSAKTPLGNIEQSIYADIVAQSILLVTPEMTEEALHILGIPIQST